MSGMVYRAELAYYLQHYRPRVSGRGHNVHDDVFHDPENTNREYRTRSCDVKTKNL